MLYSQQAPATDKKSIYHSIAFWNLNWNWILNVNRQRYTVAAKQTNHDQEIITHVHVNQKSSSQWENECLRGLFTANQKTLRANQNQNQPNLEFRRNGQTYFQPRFCSVCHTGTKKKSWNDDLRRFFSPWTHDGFFCNYNCKHISRNWAPSSGAASSDWM